MSNEQNKIVVDMKYILKNLRVSTPLGQKKLRNLKFMKNRTMIEAELDANEKVTKFCCCNSHVVEQIKIQMDHVRDIENTFLKMHREYVFDDIELYEIKNFSFVAEEINKFLLQYLPEYALPSLKDVFAILDPEGFGVNSFYIYDAYDERLGVVRKEKRKVSQDLQVTAKEKRLQALVLEEEDLENTIRRDLSVKLYRFRESLENAAKGIAYFDLLLAKAEQNEDLGLVKPVLTDGGLEYVGLFHPEVSASVQARAGTYQPVDVILPNNVTLLTGANMSGKTVLLRKLALAQTMAQMGFFVPARTAKISLVEDIFLLIGDNQSSELGLSSYAAEIRYIDGVINFVKNGGKALILLDELARSTNPREGLAIVKAMIKILEYGKSISLVTTHYNGVGVSSGVRALRVAGLKKHLLPESFLQSQDLSKYIDYSLVEEDEDSIFPEDALLIAKLLQVDEAFLKMAKELIV